MNSPLNSFKLFSYLRVRILNILIFYSGFPQDYFTNADRELEKDAQQDYHLDYAMENSTHTVIEFSRELHTCDVNDKSLTVRHVRVTTLTGSVCSHVGGSACYNSKRSS